MQKLLSALVAMLSFTGILSGISVSPAVSQEKPDVAAHEGAQPVAAVPQGSPMVVPSGVSTDNVEVKDRPLIINGDVKGSVHAVNSHVTLMPGGTVEGNLTIVGGSLSAPLGTSALIGVERRSPPAANSGSIAQKGSWFGGQFCLWLLGLIGGLILLVAAPNAKSKAVEALTMRPGSSLVAGFVTLIAICSALAVSGLIMNTRSILSVIWMPVMIVIASVSLLLLVFGWLSGMRRVGDLLARRMGQTDSGTFYGRMTLGLTAFFLFNIIIGGLIPAIRPLGLLVEFGVALMGVGAIVQTCCGRSDAWDGGRFGSDPGGSLG